MYVPDVKEKKYEKYLELFTTDVSMEKYLRSISDYICDENISPSNSDDIFFFKDIVFNTKFGKNHIFYYHWVCLDAQNS
ncbi:hypothetical protein EBU91_05280, partial [bacterium]|nr:hypothetical protein [bacterium]